MIASERVNCPVCDGEKAQTVRNAADIVKCDVCGVVYLRTRPSVKELEAWYQTYSSNPGSHMKLPATKGAAKISGLRRDEFMKELISITGKSGRLHDVGCGWGAFLDCARDNGFQVSGNEICKEMADYSRDFLDIKTWNAQLEACQIEPDSCRVITLLHSLEHLPSQRNSLGLMHDLLENGGYLCGIVPNFNSFCSQRMGDKWPWLDQNVHYVHFTQESLKETLWAFGFEMIRMYTKAGDFYPDRLREAVFQDNPKLLGDHLQRKIQELEIAGQGEECRFFAKRL